MAAWSDNPSAGKEQTTQLLCVECGVAPSDGRARGWRSYRWDEPNTDDPPSLAFYCPDCAERGFGG